MPIDTGAHTVSATCPECGGAETIGLTLTAILTFDDEAATIKLRARSKPVFHTCNDDEPTLLDEGDE